MKRAVWFGFLACAAVFGQDSSSGNAAADSLKKRIMGVDLRKPGPILLSGPVSTAPKICSIPLLQVVPPGTSDKMPVIKPQGRVITGDIVQVPAPACDDKK